MTPALLRVRGLHIEVQDGRQWRPAVRGVDIDLQAGEALGVAGESGSGKSLTALALLGLVSAPGVRVTGGELQFGGARFALRDPDSLQALRGREMAMVFQDPASALDPVFRVGGQIRRALRHSGRCARSAERERSLAALAALGFDDPQAVHDAYPHELSGGMRQRVLVAMAMAVRPRVLLADEPTTSLDVSTRALVLDALERARSEHGSAVLMISHDLSVLAKRCDRIQVMYAGQVIEQGKAEVLCRTPRHPYTLALMEAVPRLDGRPVNGTPVGARRFRARSFEATS
jgi:peptide/nickel transport system ATP-binding protein